MPCRAVPVHQQRFLLSRTIRHGVGSERPDIVRRKAVIPSSLFDCNTLCGPTLGLGTTVQLVPSQCSISVSVAASFGGATGVEKPTAHTSLGASATTPFNWLAPLPTLGLATIFQLVPSKCITSVRLLSFSGP